MLDCRCSPGIVRGGGKIYGNKGIGSRECRERGKGCTWIFDVPCSIFDIEAFVGMRQNGESGISEFVFLLDDLDVLNKESVGIILRGNLHHLAVALDLMIVDV